MLGRYCCDQCPEVIGVAPVLGNEDPDNFGFIHGVARLGLVAEATSGNDDLSFGTVAGEDDVVIEDAQNLHVFLLSSSIRQLMPEARQGRVVPLPYRTFRAVCFGFFT
jgi:hypothetical protein